MTQFFASAEFTESIKFFVALISIINPLGALPIFLFLTRSFAAEEIQKISTNCAITIFITMLLSVTLGSYILGFFGISVISFRVAGGILIAMMALNMLRAEQSSVKMNQEELDRQSQIKELGIVPLAIPLLAGPGAISTSIIYAAEFSSFYHWVTALVTLMLVSLITWLTLTYSRKIREHMGRIGLNIMTRIMGLILLSAAVETLSNGLKQMFPGLGY